MLLNQHIWFQHIWTKMHIYVLISAYRYNIYRRKPTYIVQHISTKTSIYRHNIYEPTYICTQNAHICAKCLHIYVHCHRTYMCIYQHIRSCTITYKHMYLVISACRPAALEFLKPRELASSWKTVEILEKFLFLKKKDVE